ncbi:MAG: VCBS repeat-containing protein, partial [Okeania sp. SIO1H5]|uniref:FG-GAP repeat domain-containing protein n=1 Tax=Okeania sp. SIO1H5 TaxID=2607777 RepID=UPI0013BB5EDB
FGNSGNKQGQASLGDIGGDKNLDFVTGSRGGEIRWWEYKGPDKWMKHVIAKEAKTDVGGVAVDVDGDGLVDQISGPSWYKNPGKGGKAWEEKPFGGKGVHDQRVGDIDGDGKPDLVSLVDRYFSWHKITASGEWVETPIAEGRHSGLAIGDLDGDGDNDIVRAEQWFENQENGAKWVAHPLGLVEVRESFRKKPATAAAIADLDKDGDMDVGISGHDGKNVAWLENDGQGNFTEHHLFSKGKKIHSLQLADFNNDGWIDIFAGDTDRNQHIFENLGANKAGVESFTYHLVATGPGHEARVGDVDGDGDIDFCAKPWDGGEHVYYRNMLVENGGKPSSLALPRKMKRLVTQFAMGLRDMVDLKGRYTPHHEDCDHTTQP